jgi:hypothetical protein
LSVVISGEACIADAANHQVVRLLNDDIAGVSLTGCQRGDDATLGQSNMLDLQIDRTTSRIGTV